MRIENGRLITIENGVFENGYVDFSHGKITGFGDMKDAPPAKGKVFDAKGGVIMPGMMDAHTHIGIGEEGLRWEGMDYNEKTNPLTPSMRAVDGFNPFDTSIPKALAAGITTVGVSPGSANVIGGSIAAIKLCGDNVEEMLLKENAAIKMAMGENPKSCYGNEGKTPKTRMATAAMLRDILTKAKRHMQKLDAGEDVYDAELEALIPLLKREIPAHIHAHRADDIMTAIRIMHEFNIRFCIVHATDGARIAKHLAKEDFIPLIGPSEGPASKPETMSVGFATAGQLAAEGIEVAITTDHDVQPLWQLPTYAAMCVREGLAEEAALRAITIVPAKALGVEDRVGSIAKGKDADIVVLTGHPFLYTTKLSAVFVNGEKKVYND